MNVADSRDGIVTVDGVEGRWATSTAHEIQGEVSFNGPVVFRASEEYVGDEG